MDYPRISKLLQGQYNFKETKKVCLYLIRYITRHLMYIWTYFPMSGSVQEKQSEAVLRVYKLGEKDKKQN